MKPLFAGRRARAASAPWGRLTGCSGGSGTSWGILKAGKRDLGHVQGQALGRAGRPGGVSILSALAWLGRTVPDGAHKGTAPGLCGLEELVPLSKGRGREERGPGRPERGYGEDNRDRVKQSEAM